MPQHIDLKDSASSEEENVMIMFRATDVYRSVTVTVYSGGTAIAQQKKRIVRPGEMQTIHLKAKELKTLREVKQPLTVSIELPEDSID